MEKSIYRTVPLSLKSAAVAETLWQRILTISPDSRKLAVEFAADKSLPDGEKFIVLVIHSFEPLTVGLFRVREDCHAAAEKAARMAAEKQGLGCQLCISFRLHVLWVH